MSIVRMGSTSTYAAGWDAIFGGRGAGRAGKAGRSKARAAAGRAAKRKTAAKPRPVKAAKKARKQQSARKKR
jgi:hypothetical protein